MDPRGEVERTSSLVDRLTAGDVRSVARAISTIEDGGPAAADLIARLHPYTGRAYLIGVTGAPGAGKSTLVGQLIAAYRRTGAKVAVLAVDPSSPFTGGAILGDRVRMQTHASDPAVFIRSMATRGHLGGLSASTADAVAALDAAGFGVILIETVGVGQDEVEIAGTADICLVVTVPGTGDDVQAMKAGIMEVADLFVVNKADREGADQAIAAIEQTIALDERTHDGRRPVVVRVVATLGQGIDDLVAEIEARRSETDARADRRRHDRSERRLRDLIARRAVDRARHDVANGELWRELVERIDSRQQDPYAAADMLLRRLGDHGSIDHVGVATDAIDVSVAFFRDALGFVVGEAEEVPSHGVRVRFVETGDTRVELIEAVDETSLFAKSLRARGSGLHHVAFRVADLDATLERLSAAGVRLIDRTGRPGAHGTTVAFVHPSSAQGVLVELVQKQDGDGAHR